jgi:serine/threonine protein kinase
MNDTEPEIKILTWLDHAYGIKYYEQFWSKKNHSIVMELTDGGDFSAKLGNPLPENQVLNLLKQIVEVMTYLHSKNIVHCDLKPGNIFLLNKRDDLFQAKLSLAISVFQNILKMH